MNNCLTCKWWSSDPHYRNIEDDGEMWSQCELTTEDESPEHPTRMAIAVAQFAMYPALMARHDFGCVQWEAKRATV